MSKQIYTKVCVIKSCQHFKGTRSDVQMFRIPQDDRHNEWVNAIMAYSSPPYKGLVCIHHFLETDLTSETKCGRKCRKLKKNVVPKIFDLKNSETSNNSENYADESDENAENASVLSLESVEQRNKILEIEIENLRAQYGNLRQEFFEENAQKDMIITNLQNQIKKLRETAAIKTDHNKSLMQKNLRLEKSKESLRIMINDLKNQHISSEKVMEILQKVDENEVLQCLLYGVKPGQKYSSDVRQFCFAVSFHSASAYEVIRNKFNKYLPHAQTLKAWLHNSDINGEPGIRQETMDRLKAFIRDLNGHPLVCTLIFDEMHIRKQIYWDRNKGEYVGYTTYGEQPEFSAIGNDVTTECDETDQTTNKRKTAKTKNRKLKDPKSPLANRAIVFLLSGLNKSFKFPVGYHFVNKLNGADLTQLVTEVVIKVSECGVRISNLTFDGAAENIDMCQRLGANLDALSDNFQPFIKSPFDGSMIYLTLDPSHMEKLIRNLLGNKEILFDENNQKIEWSYFLELEEISKTANLTTHKLTKKHTTEFKRNKMDVQLAVETFSASVADSMELLRLNGHEKFINCGPTVRFIHMLNKLFDVMNSRNPRHSNTYKCALKHENRREIFEFMEECESRLKSLKVYKIQRKNGVEKKVKTFVLKTISKTPILGFLMILKNIPLMYAQYVENEQTMRQFRTYTISQDHLERFFGQVRRRNGNNDNPNIVQFQGGYRRLLSNLKVKPPESGNCMLLDDVFDTETIAPNSNVYFVSSRRPKIDILSDATFQANLNKFEEEYGVESVEDLSDLQAMETTNHLMDGLAEISIAYTARLIENKIEGREFYCQCCKNVFLDNEKLSNRTICLIQSKTPCASTYYICKIANKFISMCKPKSLSSVNVSNVSGQLNNIDFKVIYFKIFQEIDYDKIYINTNFENHEEHRFHLVKCIVQQFIHIKTSQLSKQITYAEYSKIIRTKLTKWIHFCGQ